MRPELIDILICPQSGSSLKLEEPEYDGPRVRKGWLVSERGGHRYPIQGFIPRFVPEENYADRFGMQWNLFRKTQLDSSTGHPISANRFWKATAWEPANLKDRWVLDVGCGAGRFAEVAADAGANVVAVDYSSSVSACYENLAHRPNVNVIQGDIYSLPVRRAFFPYVYCLGVLQHTPDVRAAFHALLPMLLPNGEGRLCVDFYERRWQAMIQPKYPLRIFTKHMNKEKLFRTLQRLTPSLLFVSDTVSRVPKVGHLLRRAVPVANQRGILPLTERELTEWALLDTFDWLSPKYDNPQTRATVRRWLEEAGLIEIEVLKAGHLVGRGRTPTVLPA